MTELTPKEEQKIKELAVDYFEGNPLGLTPRQSDARGLLQTALDLFELTDACQTPGTDAYTWRYHASDYLNGNDNLTGEAGRGERGALERPAPEEIGQKVADEIEEKWSLLVFSPSGRNLKLRNIIAAAISKDRAELERQNGWLDARLQDREATFSAALTAERQRREKCEAAMQAAAYLIDRLQISLAGKPVRNLDEAFEAYSNRTNEAVLAISRYPNASDSEERGG